jgi:hypothetical protein
MIREGVAHEHAMFAAEAVDSGEGTDCFCLGVLSLVRSGRALYGLRSLLAWPGHSRPKSSPGVPGKWGQKGAAVSG